MGGAERRFLRLIGYLHENEYDVHLFTSEGGVRALESLGVAFNTEKLHVLSVGTHRSNRVTRHFALISRTFELLRVVRKNNIRHLHFAGNPGVDTLLFSLVSKLACSFSVSMVDSIKDYQLTFRKRLFTNVTARFCKYIDCLSEQIRGDLCLFLDDKGIERKCRVSPCSFTDLNAAISRESRDIDIAMIARMIPLKGHELFKNALVELGNQNRTGIVVHVCGSGPNEAEIRDSFEAVKGQRINIHYEENPFDILARSKVFVSLQDLENYPSQSLLEAMICKCAIIATDVGSTRQLLDESCAVLIPPDPAVLASALQKLLDSRKLRDTLGSSAARKVAETQTIDKFAEYFLVELFGIGITH